MITNPNIPQRFHGQFSWEGKICFKHKRLLIWLHWLCRPTATKIIWNYWYTFYVCICIIWHLAKGSCSSIFSCLSQQSPQWNQFSSSLSSVSSFLAPTIHSFMSSFTTATNPFVVLPLRLLSDWIIYQSGYLKFTTFFTSAPCHLIVPLIPLIHTSILWVGRDSCFTISVSLSNSMEQGGLRADPWWLPPLPWTLLSHLEHTDIPSLYTSSPSNMPLLTSSCKTTVPISSCAFSRSTKVKCNFLCSSATANTASSVQ